MNKRGRHGYILHRWTRLASACNENTLPHNWNLWFSYVIILVQCNFVMIFQSIVILVCYHNNSPNVNVCATWLIYVPNHTAKCKNRLEFPFKSCLGFMKISPAAAPPAPPALRSFFILNSFWCSLCWTEYKRKFCPCLPPKMESRCGAAFRLCRKGCDLKTKKWARECKKSDWKWRNALGKKVLKYGADNTNVETARHRESMPKKLYS